MSPGGSAAYGAGEVESTNSTAAILPPTAPVNLGRAGAFVILSKSGITDVPASDVTGNIGTSPITGAADTVTCAEVTGKIFSVDFAGPAPCSIKAPSKLSTAVDNMQTAYTDAAGRPAKTTELGAGEIGGLTLSPGVYRWSTDVLISKNVTLKGGLNEVWIFQISKNLLLASGKAVVLRGNARAKNIFWQVAGKTTLSTTSHLEGTVLCKTLIALKTGASVDGRLFSQTAVTLQKNRIVVR
jgi:hypothetical protein